MERRSLSNLGRIPGDKFHPVWLDLLRTRSPTLYWYSLGLLCFGVSLIGIVFTVKIGEAVNWCGRIGLYVSGLLFLTAVISSNDKDDERAGVSKRWAEAFSKDPEQISAFFSNMSEGVTYGRVITDNAEKPVDFVYLDVNDAYERIQGLTREKIIGKRVTDSVSGFGEISSRFHRHSRASRP